MNEVISVIVPVYNVENYIEKCIKSILNQTYSNLEIILIDDGSKDSSGKICDKYAKIDNRIKVIHKKNEGQSIARNVGLKIAKGKFIGFVDSDDYIDDNMFEKLYKAIIDNKADISVCDIMHIKGKKNIKLEEHKLLEVYDRIGAIKQLLCNYITNYVYNKLYKREIWSKIKFPKGKLMEDMDVMYRLFEKANKIVCTNEAKYYYVWRNNSSIAKIDKNITCNLKDIVNRRYEYLKSNEPELIDLLNIDKMINIIQYHYNLSYAEEREEYFSKEYSKEYNFFLKNFKKYKDKILSEGNFRKKLEIIMLFKNRKIYYDYTIMKKKMKKIFKR